MAKNLSFKEFSDTINKMSKDFQQEVKEITEFNLGDIELAAIRDAPASGDQIRTEFGTEIYDKILQDRGRKWTPVSQAIGYSIDSSGYKGSVYVERSAGDPAIWIEMGTGQDASNYLSTVPPEYAAIAARFYRNGKGTILHAPYLLPNFMKQKLEYVKDLKKALEKLKL